MTLALEHRDILIIGAGPAGLSCAITLVERGFNGSIEIIEAGRNYHQRHCPVDNHRTCKGCGGVCNVISGFGGSIHYGDGVKLSGFPSGRRLLALLGEERAQKSLREAVALLLNKELVDFFVPSVENLPFTVKTYPILSLDSEAVKQVVNRLYNFIRLNNCLRLRLNTQVDAIEPREGFFDVISNSLSVQDKQTVYRAKKVVVAVGRKGFLWWRKELRRLGVQHLSPVSSVGLRFECPSEFLKAAASLHPDLKITTHEENLKFKTFCFCAGEGGGRIKFTDYGPFTLLDGHVIPERDRPARTANFALLAQLRDDEGHPHPFEWIEKHLLGPYKNLNSERPGKPIIQWYPDFKNCRLTCTDLAQLYHLSGLTASVSDYMFANLGSMFSEATRKAFCSVFERLFSWFSHLSEDINKTTSFEEKLARVCVLGLELEGLWDEVSVDPFMQSSLKNLYVAGDCAGVAQGILQAAVTGIEIANHCLDGTFGT